MNIKKLERCTTEYKELSKHECVTKYINEGTNDINRTEITSIIYKRNKEKEINELAV